jgi:dihydrodipicolinate synthase/N-acetylneuraminate lyase
MRIERREGKMSERNSIGGIITPIITPLNENKSLDETGLRRVIHHCLKGGVHGVLALGTTGELGALPLSVRKQVMRICVAEINKQIPLFVGVSACNEVEVMKNIEEAYKRGADYVVLHPPYYFILKESAILKFIQSIVEKSPLPVILYNHPELTKNWISERIIKELITNERIRGLKDSSGDMKFFKELSQFSQKYTHFSLIMGIEKLMVEAILNGAAGAVPGGSNIYPKLFVELYEASLSHDSQRIDALQKSLQELVKIYSFGAPSSSYLISLKTAMSLMGLCKKYTAQFEPLASKYEISIREILLGLGLLKHRAHKSKV